jgi:hypothetical protein
MKFQLRKCYCLQNQYCKMLSNFNMRAIRDMSKQYSIFLQVFSSICGVTVSIAAKFLSFSSSREVTVVF